LVGTVAHESETQGKAHIVRSVREAELLANAVLVCVDALWRDVEIYRPQTERVSHYSTPCFRDNSRRASLRHHACGGANGAHGHVGTRLASGDLPDGAVTRKAMGKAVGRSRGTDLPASASGHARGAARAPRFRPAHPRSSRSTCVGPETISRPPAPDLARASLSDNSRQATSKSAALRRGARGVGEFPTPLPAIADGARAAVASS
jgi:hypothetical protein